MRYVILLFLTGAGLSLAACGGTASAGDPTSTSPQNTAAANSQALQFAQCMRKNGVPNFPDPTNGGSSGPVFNITKAGISDSASHAPRFMAKLTECGRLAGANAPESFE